MSCDYIHFTLELNTDDFSYIVTGLERIHHYLDKEPFLSCDKITLNDACLVLGREQHLINVPICYFKYVAFNHVGNAIQVVADVVHLAEPAGLAGLIVVRTDKTARKDLHRTEIIRHNENVIEAQPVEAGLAVPTPALA